MKQLEKISNPLTVIAIFSGFAEVACTVALPRLEGNVQFIFVWFAVLFPIVLVVLFFLTMNFNRKVLYAPSDFTNEDHFLRLIEKGIEQSPKISSIEEEVQPLVRRASEDDETDLAEQVDLKENKPGRELTSEELRVLKVLRDGRWIYRSLTGLAKEVLDGNRNLTNRILSDLKDMGVVAESVRGRNKRYYLTEAGRQLLKNEFPE